MRDNNIKQRQRAGDAGDDATDGRARAERLRRRQEQYYARYYSDVFVCGQTSNISSPKLAEKNFLLLLKR